MYSLWKKGLQKFFFFINHQLQRGLIFSLQGPLIFVLHINLFLFLKFFFLSEGAVINFPSFIWGPYVIASVAFMVEPALVLSLELLLLVGPDNSSLFDFSLLAFFFLVGRFLSIMFNSLQSKRKEEEKKREYFAQCNDEIRHTM